MSVHTSRHALDELFVHLGYKGVERWSEKRVRSTIDKLPSTVDDETDLGDHEELVNELLGAVEDNVEIVIADEEEPAPKKRRGAKKAAKKSPAKKTTKGAKKAPAKKKTAKKDTKKVSRRTGGKSNKQIVYAMYAKNPDKAGEKVEQMLETVDHAVKEQTIRSWISQWRRGENYPAGVEK